MILFVFRMSSLSRIHDIIRKLQQGILAPKSVADTQHGTLESPRKSSGLKLEPLRYSGVFWALSKYDSGTQYLLLTRRPVSPPLSTERRGLYRYASSS